VSLLGGKYGEDFSLYRAISQDLPERMAANVAGYRAEGYTKFQLKVGGDPDVDIERIKAVAAEMQRGDVLVALAPLARAGLIAPGATINIASASGVSGAGASPKLELLFAEVTEDYRPYGVANSHRHLFEMRATMQRLGADCDLLFTPHLLPVDRGILSTISVPLTRPMGDGPAPFRRPHPPEPVFGARRVVLHFGW